MKPAVLIVDDDPAICDVLCDVLNEHVFTVHACHRGSEALALLNQQPDIALVLLDLILPDTNGLLVLQQIHRLRPDLPVVMLTGLGSESDVVVGLEMGADDYIAKPFNPRVVVARAKAVLRRTGALALEPVAVGQGKPEGWQFNGWCLDAARCTLHNPQRQPVDLTQGEYGLLLALVQHARKVLTRDRLLELTHSETLEVFDRTIDVLIMRLRRKIEINPHQPELIRTIRGLGYVFAADVSQPVAAA
ncbi:response regulator [Serratia plymuthica]|uniref:DNA-binding dual transcriptional regulator OmpR n=2 Tax=Serratia plymuthica TaxID=82996 RepID=A0A318PDW8_SERPL|nr:response regulator transcription factor [Serratia plymuthica]AGO53883.1 transcriptional regulatory protein OmpR [Serratia plymuthica 4Rx13]AGP43237.1 OmpR [Serratia plymuthica S13]AHY05946.1 histidine kinase [Serratia plymuthica]ANJ92600.1 histidine kinase [Serratia plymuthica]EKF65935.1 putative transcriptional regulator [Serratia plymuthica A30]